MQIVPAFLTTVRYLHSTFLNVPGWRLHRVWILAVIERHSMYGFPTPIPLRTCVKAYHASANILGQIKLPLSAGEIAGWNKRLQVFLLPVRFDRAVLRQPFSRVFPPLRALREPD